MKILLLEDDLDIHKLLKINLEKSGYDVFSCYDGKAVIDIIKKESFDLFLLDVMVPKIDGFTVLEFIRDVSDAPAIFLTAKLAPEDKIHGLNLGADDYVEKPFHLEELLSRVQANLRRYNKYKGTEEKLLVNGPLTVDVTMLSVTLSEKEILLNPKELKILMLLMGSINRIFTKKQIYEAVWEDAYYGDSNTIMVHISNLRDKLGEYGKNILTVKGLGYKLKQVD